VIEAEAKYRSPGNDKVEKSLARLGAKKISEGTIEDVYFAHPAKDFGRTDEALRLRKKHDSAELTYKGPRMKSDKIKAREEISVDVGSQLAAQRIIERLGFTEIGVVRKMRKSYIYDKMRVDIDDVEGLGEFVELEILTESPERSEQLFETAVKELSLENLESRTYLEMKSSQKAED
jgi:adenylate cyclase class 2